MMPCEMLRVRLWSAIPRGRLYNKRRGNPELRQPLCNLVEPLCMSDPPPPLRLTSRQSAELTALGCARASGKHRPQLEYPRRKRLKWRIIGWRCLKKKTPTTIWSQLKWPQMFIKKKNARVLFSSLQKIECWHKRMKQSIGQNLCLRCNLIISIL